MSDAPSLLQLPDAPSLVLASRSPSRARLLRAAGLAFAQTQALIDEAAVREAMLAEGVPVEDAALGLAELKAAAVARALQGDVIVLAADQMLEVEGEWLEKPADLAAARRQLERLRGRRHLLVSGAVAYRGGTRVWHHADTARLWLRDCSEAMLDAYLAAAGPAILDCVGAYQLEGLGLQLMARVEGDLFTIQGLPLLAVLQFLRDQGVLAA